MGKVILKCTCLPKCMRCQEFGKVKQKYGSKENRNRSCFIKINIGKILVVGLQAHRQDLRQKAHMISSVSGEIHTK